MVYEKMKAWGFERKRRQHEKAGKVYNMQGDKLVSTINYREYRVYYIFLSSSQRHHVAKNKPNVVEFLVYHHVNNQQAGVIVGDLSVPSRAESNTGALSHVLCGGHGTDKLLKNFKNNAQSELFPTIPATIKRTWANEGFRGFFRGLGTNLVRVLPGTCITFVVYENLAWLLRTSAARKAALLKAENDES
jgi:solute carrier family 25 folate transporter 32